MRHRCDIPCVSFLENPLKQLSWCWIQSVGLRFWGRNEFDFDTLIGYMKDILPITFSVFRFLGAWGMSWDQVRSPEVEWQSSCFFFAFLGETVFSRRFLTKILCSNERRAKLVGLFLSNGGCFCGTICVHKYVSLRVLGPCVPLCRSLVAGTSPLGLLNRALVSMQWNFVIDDGVGDVKRCFGILQSVLSLV